MNWIEFKLQFIQTNELNLNWLINLMVSKRVNQKGWNANVHLLIKLAHLNGGKVNFINFIRKAYLKKKKLYHIIYYIIKVGFKCCSCAKWLYRIAETLLDFFLKIDIYFLSLSSSPIISKWIKILIWLQSKFFM